MARRKARRWIVAAGILAGWVVGGFANRPAGRSRAQEAPRGGKYALLVGIDRYGKGTLPPGLGDSPRNDVEGMAEALREVGYKQDDVAVMTLKTGSEEPDLLPNAENIRNQLVRTRHATSPMPRLLGDVGFVVLRDRSAIPPSPEFITSKATGVACQP